MNNSMCGDTQGKLNNLMAQAMTEPDSTHSHCSKGMRTFILLIMDIIKINKDEEAPTIS